MSYIFISYSRKDLDFAQKIVDALTANKLDTWVDWKSIPKGEDWEQEIYHGIEEADAFLFLLSPDSVKSEICGREISHAASNGKRILPIVIRDVELKTVHPEISKRNWIFSRNGQDDFNKAMEETRKTIATDYEWLKFHTELQVKALKWEQKKDVSRLLRGKELREADNQLNTLDSHKDPQSTDIQRLFILNSRRNEERQRRQITFGLGLGIVILIILSIFAWGQRNSAVDAQNTAVAEAKAKSTALVNEKNARATAQAEKDRAELQAQIALSRQLAAQAKLNLENNLPLSILLSVEASNTKSTFEAQEILLRGLQQNRRLKKILSRHKDSITSLALNTLNGSKVLASGSQDGTIILWDFSDPIKPIVLKIMSQAHSGAVYSLALSSQDNRDILVSGGNEQIIFWDITTPTTPIQLTTLQSPPIPGGNYISLSISPGGDSLAIGGGSSVSFWDIANPASSIQVGEAPSNPFGTNELAFDRTGKILATQAQQYIELWNVSNWTTPFSIQTLSNFPGSIITSAKFWIQPNKTMMALGTETGAIQLWKIDPNNQPISLGAPALKHSSPVVTLAFSPDGKTLVSKGYDGTVIYWDLSSSNSESWQGEYLQNKTTDTKIAINFSEELKGASANFKSTGMVFSTDGKFLISGNDDGSIFLWDMTNSAEPLASLPNPLGNPVPNSGNGSILKFGFLDNKNVMATRGGDDKLVKLWDISDISNPRLINKPLLSTRAILGFRSDDKLLILGSDNGIDFWDLTDPLVPIKISSLSLPFSQDGDTVIISPTGRALIFRKDKSEKADLWDISNPNQPIRMSSFTMQQYSQLAFSPDGKILAIDSCQKGTRLWNIADPKNPVPFGLPFWAKENWRDGIGGCIYQMKFNSTGNVLVASASESSILADIVIWNITNPQQPIRNNARITDQLLRFAVSPDGKRLVSVDGFGQIVVWDVSSPSNPARLGNLSGIVSWTTNKIEFSLDSKILAIWDDAGGLILWDMDVNSWKVHACEVANRNLSRAEWTQYIGDALPYQAVCPNLPIEAEVITTPTP